MSLEEEKNFAEKNISLMLSNMPSSLVAKEDKAFHRAIESKLSTLKKLEELYKTLNDLSHYAQTYAPCKKGCSSCCHYEVSVTDIEIQYIELFAKKKRRSRYLPLQNFHGTPCPFLIENACSIYHARPFFCRRHMMFTKTNDWCHPNVSNSENFALVNFTQVQNAFNLIKQASNSQSTFDIRQVF